MTGTRSSSGCASERGIVTEADYLEDNIATVAHHLRQDSARLSVDHVKSGKAGLLVEPGEVLREIARRLSVAQPTEEPIPPVQRIETVKGIFSEEGQPIWRLIIDKCCIDFETETAANNARNAILSLSRAAQCDYEHGKLYVYDAMSQTFDVAQATPEPVEWQPIETCPKDDDQYYFLFNELWEVEGWANVERAYWFEHTWIFDSGLTLLDCDTKFNPTMWHPDTTPAAPATVVSSTDRGGT